MTQLISVTNLLKKTWLVYREKFTVLIGVMIVPFMLFVINPLLAQTEDFLILPLALVIALLASFGIFWAGASVIIALRDHDEVLTPSEAYKRSWKKIWPLVWVAFLSSFIIAGGFYLFVIPGIIFTIFFLFAQLVLLVEGDKGLRSLVKSREYVRGYFWPIVGRYLVILIASLAVCAVFSLLGTFVSEAFSSAINSMAGLVVSIVWPAIMNIFITPFILVYTYLLYEDLKKTKKGVDTLMAKKQGRRYLLIGLAGWILLLVMILLVILIATSAVGGYLIGTAVTEIFNDQVLLKSVQ